MIINASPRVATLVKRYDALQEEVYRARQTYAKLSQALINPVTVRFQPDHPTGYGLSYDMSKIKLPNLKDLGAKIHEWQTIRAQLIRILADPKTDKQTCLFLDSKLHVRVRGC